MAPVSLLLKTDDGFAFNLESLQKVLSNRGIDNLPLAIISIAGEFRKGKSFLISHAAAKLKGCELNNKDDYFRFEKSSKRQTEGIDLWDEPFVITRKDGTKLAVLLMDTQGTFDTKTTLNDNTLIFGLSATISSLLMYNLIRQIDSNDLDNLAYFVDFGLAAQQSGHKIYQDLIFVIRDWVNTEDFDYGFDGGNGMLKHNREKAHESIRGMYDKITAAFSSSRSFLCPPPGDRVFEESFTGKLSELNQDFQTHFSNLLDDVLNKDNIQPKMINGKQLLCKDASDVIAALFDVLVKAPKAKDLLELTSRSTHEKAKETALAGFAEKCSKIEARFETSSIDECSKLLYNAKQEAVEVFLNSPRIGQNIFESEYLKELEESLKEKYNEVKESHLRILETATLRNNNHVLSENNRETEKENERMKSENDKLEKEMRDLKLKQENDKKELARNLEEIKKHVTDSLKRIEDEIRTEKELFDRRKMELEQEMEEQRERAEKLHGKMDRETKRLNRDLEEERKRTEEELEKLQKNHEKFQKNMEEQNESLKSDIIARFKIMGEKEQMRNDAHSKEMERIRERMDEEKKNVSIRSQQQEVMYKDLIKEAKARNNAEQAKTYVELAMKSLEQIAGLGKIGFDLYSSYSKK